MGMNYTSAQANKLLKKLNDEYTALLDKETRSRDFRAAMGEDVESVRPVYDYAETQIRLAELEAKIRKLKHAINIFNATQTVDSFDMTIDELLVYIPQLTKRKSKLPLWKAQYVPYIQQLHTEYYHILSHQTFPARIWS